MVSLFDDEENSREVEACTFPLSKNGRKAWANDNQPALASCTGFNGGLEPVLGC